MRSHKTIFYLITDVRRLLFFFGPEGAMRTDYV